MKKKIRYKDLSEEQKKGICNGCGAKGGWFNPPDFIYKSVCNHHDFNYWLGCTESDRIKADFQFLEQIYRIAKDYSFFRRWHYYFIGVIYFSAVRVFGKRHFYYADKERTLQDLGV